MANKWEVKNLGEICDIQNGYAFHSKDYTLDGYRVIRIGNVQNGKIVDKLPKFIPKNLAQKSKEFILKEDDILISLTGDVGRTGRINSDLLPAVLNQRVGRIRNISKQMDKDYLFHFLNSDDFEQLVIKSATGAAQKNTSTNKIKNIEIPIPPLSEQKKIVKFLDEAFEKIEKAQENTEKNLKNSQELFEAYLEQVFNRDGDEWREEKLGAVAEIDKAKNNSGNLPYVGMEDIASNEGIFLGSKEPRRVKSSTFHFSPKHILYGRLRPYLNKVLAPNFEGHCSTEIFPIKTSKALNKKLLFYWLLRQSIMERINATCTGARMPRANMDLVFDSFTIRYPVSLTAQKKMANELDELYSKSKVVKNNYENKLGNLEKLRAAILGTAFTN